MLSLEIRAGGSAQKLALDGRLVLGAAHGLPEGALALEARGDHAIASAKAEAQVGAQKLAAGSRRLLRPGDVVKIGAVEVALVALPDAAPQTKLLARAMLRGTPLPVKPGLPSLLWLNGPDIGRRVVLMEQATFVGRGEGCVARVNDALASRMHAKLVRTGDSFQVVDFLSANGLLVDGVRLAGSQGLRGGETIQIGNTILAFEKPLEPQRPTPPPEPPKPVEAKVEHKSEPKPEPVGKPEPKKKRKPALAGFEVMLMGLALFAAGAGAVVIAWAVR